MNQEYLAKNDIYLDVSFENVPGKAGVKIFLFDIVYIGVAALYRISSK